MRIIRGKYNRRIISPPTYLPVRPTTDMAKESLFNILNNYLDFDAKSALDLFAGTGNISYEFVSRGCSAVTAVDKASECLKFIAETAQKFNMTELHTMYIDVFSFLTNTSNNYDIIFADPPYNLTNITDISKLVFKNNLLNQGGWLIIEHPAEINFSESLNFYDHRKYGRVNFSFFHIKD